MSSEHDHGDALDEIAFLKDELHNVDCAYSVLRDEVIDLRDQLADTKLIAAFWKEAANSACDGWSATEDRYLRASEWLNELYGSQEFIRIPEIEELLADSKDEAP